MTLDLSFLTNFFYDYIQGFFTWFAMLTWWQIVAIMSLMLVDIGRTVGKAIALTILNLKRHFRPFDFGLATVSYPKISLVIPAHNESVSIKDTIEAALENNYTNKEIIIVDDHSSDDTYNLAKPYVERGLIKLLRRSGIKGSRASAVNYGALYATGEIIMVTDGDTLIERNTLKEVAKYMSLPNVVAVAGNVRVLGGDKGVNNYLTKCQSYEYLISFELGRRVRTILNVLVIIPGAFSAFRKEAGKKIGLYDIDNVTEDFDLTLKLFKTSGKVEFVSNAIAWTYCPNNWRAWIRQRMRWSHGQIVTLLKHKDIITTRNKTYSFLFLLGVYDMIFVDIILLFARTISIVWLLLVFNQSILYVFTFVFLVYFMLELIAIVAAASFSKYKEEIKYIYLTPFMIFVYRPLHAYVRLYAFVKAILGKKVEW
jgi:cellulose synthase/poly-beta-1,6-N-acetylglucosamine synthase-like glycosyltransferase